MAISNDKYPLYLEADTLGEGLGGDLLQIRDGMNCLMDMTSDIAILLPIAFASMSLSSTKTN